MPRDNKIKPISDQEEERLTDRTTLPPLLPPLNSPGIKYPTKNLILADPLESRSSHYGVVSEEEEDAHPLPEKSTIDEQRRRLEKGLPTTPRARFPSTYSLSFTGNKEEGVPLVLSFENLCYSIPAPGQKQSFFSKYFTHQTQPMKQVLHDISGEIRPGEMIAIMGASGAGKTTLLNVLAGRISEGKITGSIQVNKRPRSKKYWRRQMGYVMQEDLMFESLTVKETIEYAALLRLPSNMFSTADKLQCADAVINELRLQQCVNSAIGGASVRGISGGEKKRVSIGVELVTNPSLLFLDEPTSGLDANTALSVIKRLQGLATGTRAVLMTIHQPRSDIVDLFSKVLLLSQGRLIFFGSIDSAKEHFSSLGFPCPQYTNPSDFFMDIISVDQRTPESKKTSQQRVDFLYDSYRRKQLEMKEKLDKIMNPEVANDPEMLEAGLPGNEIYEEVPIKWACGRFEEFSILFRRNLKNYLRTKTIVLLQVLQNLFLAFLCGTIFFRLGNSYADDQNRRGLLFFVTSNQAMTWILPIVTVFPQDRVIFMRERSAGSYRVSSYFLSKVLSELPVQLGIPFGYGLLVYWSTGLQPRLDRFLFFEAILVSLVFTAQSLGLAIGAAVPDVATGNVVAPLLSIFLMLFGGFFVNMNSIPPIFLIFKFISLVNYGYKAFMINEYSGLTFSCGTTDGCVTSGDQILANLQMDGTIGENILALLLMSVILRLLAFYLLLFLSKPKQKLV